MIRASLVPYSPSRAFKIEKLTPVEALVKLEELRKLLEGG